MLTWRAGRPGWAQAPALTASFPPGPPPGESGDEGLFGPGSAAWLLGRERVLLAGGPAALLLQVAHPLVGAAVAEHSDFATDPLQRLRGTLDATLTVTFGDSAQVQAAAAAVARRHRPVRGRLTEGSGGFAAGTGYRADDPELAGWVFATLVWTAVTVTQTLIGPAAATCRDAYYTDLQQFGQLFGVAPERMPADYAGLEKYVHQTAQDVLVVGPIAHRLAAQILTPEPPVLPPPLRPLPSVLAAGLLPTAVRDAYGLPWRRRERALFAAVRTSTRHAVPALPPRVRFWPHYRTALRRVHSPAPAAGPPVR